MNVLVSSATAQLYEGLLKPVFFKFDPEDVHNHMVSMGSAMAKVPFVTDLLGLLWAEKSPRLSKTIDGITFPNPVGLSAGFDYNGDLTQILPSVGFGFHTIGTVTLRAYDGNPKPRLGRFPDSKALLVNKGLKNLGASIVIKKLRDVAFQIPTGISIASTNTHFDSEAAQIAEICACFRLFEKSGLKHVYYELNISCPNTFGGEPFTTPEKLRALLKKIDKLLLTRPVYVKMPIDLSEKVSLSLLTEAAKHRVAGVIYGNLTKDRTNPDVASADRDVWRVSKGNLSGKPTWERSNRLIALTKKHFKDRFTIIGTGGIFSPADAREKMRLGADLVQLITGMIYKGPQLIGQINHYLVVCG